MGSLYCDPGAIPWWHSSVLVIVCCLTVNTKIAQLQEPGSCSTIDLRDAFHTLHLAKTSQKYCGITPYYGSPTYHYLFMGMVMSVSPQIWQQFINLVFQDDLIKRKQNFDVIMDDTFIHSMMRNTWMILWTYLRYYENVD